MGHPNLPVAIPVQDTLSIPMAALGQHTRYLNIPMTVPRVIHEMP